MRLLHQLLVTFNNQPLSSNSPWWIEQHYTPKGFLLLRLVQTTWFNQPSAKHWRTTYQVAQDDHSYLSVSELHIQTPSFRLPHWADPLQTHRRQLVKSSSPLFRRSALHSRIILRKLIQEQHRGGWSPLSFYPG